MSVFISDYLYFLYMTLGMTEIPPKRFYEFKKNELLFSSMKSLSNYHFQFKMFENSHEVLIIYLSCYNTVHYERYQKNGSLRLHAV